jgi:hypothetical protein
VDNASPGSGFVQLPTPPDEPQSPPKRLLTFGHDAIFPSAAGLDTTSPASSFPDIDEDLPSFEDSHLRNGLDPLNISGDRFDFPDPSSTRGSPSSSSGDLAHDSDSAASVNEVEVSYSSSPFSSTSEHSAAGPRSQIKRESKPTDFDEIDT